MILLQQTTPQLDNAISQVTKASIELAQATSDYGALKMIFGIFMIFMILIVCLFVYQILTLTKKIDVIHDAAVRTKDYFDDVSDRTIGHGQAQVIIRRSINGLSSITKYAILRIKLENHIDNEEGTRNKVYRVVKNEFSELNAFLANFICDDKPLCDIMDDDDIKLIEDFMMEQIYIPKEEFSVYNMDQSVDILMNGIKLTYLKKL